MHWPASCIKVDDAWLGLNQEKKLIGGERITFSEDKTRRDVFDYTFYLAKTEPLNELKRIREESPESTSITFTNQDNQKLVKIQRELVQELICPLCIEMIDKCATLSMPT